MNYSKITFLKGVIARILRKYGPTRQNQLKDAFGLWRLRSTGGQKIIVKKVAGSIKDFELDYVAKVGGLHILFTHLKSLNNLSLKHAFDKIKHQTTQVFLSNIVNFFSRLTIKLETIPLNSTLVVISKSKCY